MGYNDTQQFFLGDLYDISSGLSKNKEQFGSGYPFLSFKTVFNYTIIPTDLKDLAQTTLSEQNKYSILYGDVFLTRTSETANELGMSSVALKDYPQATFNGFTKRLRPKKGVMEFIDPKFIAYYLRSKDFRNQIDSISVLTTRASLNQGMIEKLTITVPNIETQKKIAAILSALDEKIAINRAINENLERQAQSYFQELFVDNADPEWTTGTISDLGAVVGGSTPSKAKPEYYTESGIAWITPKDLSINKSKFVSHGENDITELGLKNSSAAIMPEGTVLFSSRAPIGYIAIAACEVTTNQGFKSVVPKPEIGTPFVYFFLKNTLPVIEGMASGSTFKEVSGSTMKNVPAVIPDAETLAKFSDFCAPIFAQQRILEEQNQSLAMLRDNVLPKLMSGEIDVSDVQL